MPSDLRLSTNILYSNISAFDMGMEELLQHDDMVNVTRAYTNPVNAIQSIAFCCPVTLKEGQAVLLRIIPVSSFEKRQAKSEAYTANPFKYSFYPVPSTEKGGYFINSVSIGFGVNKNSKNLSMANGFMRFLVSTEELNLMAKAKRMVTPCVDMSLDSVYAPFGNLSSDRFINTSELGLSDAASSQVSKAGWQVSNGNMTIDEAIRDYGKL